MSEYKVKNNGALHGTVRISGAKNAALPIMAASLLSDGICVLDDIPDLRDVSNMIEIISHLGGSVKQLHKNSYEFFCGNVNNFSAPYETANKLRASFLVMGPLIAKYGYTKIPLPGGCPIGSRPVDLHLKGFASLGADVSLDHGYAEVKAAKLHGANIYLDFPSVGATENIMMAACLADGQTVIANSAVEPEIVDLANFLNLMGAEITGAGTDNIKINGVKSLLGGNYTIIPDRIEAGTFMVAAAITGGKVRLENAVCDHLKPLSAKLREIGIKTEEDGSSITVSCEKPLRSCDIKTLPFPGFPTDMQAQLCALMSTVHGTSIITETVFENRFMHIGELQRMGANIKLDGRTAVIDGGNLTGAEVKATDLRAGAALCLAGLCADGVTNVSGTEYIERGYEKFPDKLTSLGADIQLT